jgi:6-phosphogluconolactonase
LTPAGQIATAREPRGLALDDAGRFLFASGMEEDLLSAFSIDTGNGALTLASTTPTGKGPNWIEFVRLP